jgi:hypothetical protein
MRYQTITTLFAIMILATGIFAADNPPIPSSAAIQQDIGIPMPSTGYTVLEINPMQRELEEVLMRMKDREELLIKELISATDDKQTEQIIRRIEKLDVDRELALLKVKARYARLSGRFDLEKEIKNRILVVLTSDLAMMN